MHLRLFLKTSSSTYLQLQQIPPVNQPVLYRVVFILAPGWLVKWQRHIPPSNHQQQSVFNLSQMLLRCIYTQLFIFLINDIHPRRMR